MSDPLFLELQAALAGRYSLLAELGRGGMGIVYLAREVRLDRLVALKLLPPALAGVSDLRERFLREARTAARLTHPNIIPVYTADESGALAWFVMAYVKGETLAARVARLGPRPPDEVARIARQAAFALAYAHAQGVIHRDVKPENIMLEDGTGRVLLADFGIAQTAETATDPGRRIGTPKWMAPEQLAGESVDARADLYALGLVMRFASGEMTPRLHAIVARSTLPAPAGRYGSAEDMASALEALGTRERIAPMLERWVANGEALRGSEAFLSVVMLAPMTVLLDLLFDGLFSGAGKYDQTAALWVTLFAPMVLWAGFRLADLRRMLRSGFTRRDLLRAIDARTRALEEQAADAGNVPPAGVAKAARLVVAAGVASGGVALAAMLVGSADSDVAVLMAGGYTALAGLVAAWRVWRKAQGPAAEAGHDTRNRFWSGRWGRLMERLALFGLARKTSAQALEAQPTEIGLAGMADRMYEALPPAQRAQLPDLTGLVRRLEARARDAREKGNEQELAASVTALENIRLDLMRLAMHTRAGLTADLDEARRIGERIDAIS